NSGRRSSNLPEWGQPLLDKIRSAGYSASNVVPLDAAQTGFAARLRAILETDPFEVRVDDRTAEAVISDILDQADERDKAGPVAQYLVGSKLMLRFPMCTISVRPYNQGDAQERQADF